MTTQAVILAAVSLASSVSLTVTGSSILPSQVGQQGRPRKNGRVTVMRGNLTAEQFGVHTIRARLASEFAITDPKSLTHYLRECSANEMTFVVPGLDANSRVMYEASVDAPAPVAVEASPEPEATMALVVEESVDAVEAASPEVDEALAVSDVETTSDLD